MARVASCPQCNHELFVPSEADSESWAKCPECRAFFQVKQAASREVLAALLVDGSEQTVELDPNDVASPTMTAQDDVETAIVERHSTVKEVAATRADDLELDDLIVEPKEYKIEVAATPPDEVEAAVASPMTVEHGIAADQGDDLTLEDPIAQPKKRDDLEEAAQRIDEWFRSAKTVPDTAPVGADGSAPSVEEIGSELAPAGPPRTDQTIDMDSSDADEIVAMADFDLGEPDEPRPSTDSAKDNASWDDTEHMDELLGVAEAPSADEFVSEFADADDADSFGPKFAQDQDSMDVEPPTNRDEEPAINLFSDDASDAISSRRRAPRRKRSLARSLILIVAAGLFGSAAGYYALLWLRGPSIDILNVAQYLPKSILPTSFEQPKQIVRNAPPAPTADTTADAEPATTDGAVEPQELQRATDETAEPLSDATVASDAPPADATDQSTEVQASFSEDEPAADEAAPAAAVGDRYATTASETEAAAPNDSTATDVTSEKPVTTDLSVDDLAPAEPLATDSTADTAAAVEPSVPASTEPAATESTNTETAGNEPAAFDVTSVDPLSEITDTNDVTESVEIVIANAPSFTGADLRNSMDAAAKAHPQLVAGNFADSKAVAQAKGRSYAMLADLAQKAMFTDASQPSAQPLLKQADELFRRTLADAHTRGEIAQILPRWISSPNRKHGGVFFGGKVVGHTTAGSVVECNVELDGGQTVTVLAPADAADQLDTAKPMAIVGWIVDATKTQVSGYTGAVKSPAIWTNKLIPLE